MHKYEEAIIKTALLSANKIVIGCCCFFFIINTVQPVKMSKMLYFNIQCSGVE